MSPRLLGLFLPPAPRGWASCQLLGPSYPAPLRPHPQLTSAFSGRLDLLVKPASRLSSQLPPHLPPCPLGLPAFSGGAGREGVLPAAAHGLGRPPGRRGGPGPPPVSLRKPRRGATPRPGVPSAPSSTAVPRSPLRPRLHGRVACSCAGVGGPKGQRGIPGARARPVQPETSCLSRTRTARDRLWAAAERERTTVSGAPPRLPPRTSGAPPLPVGAGRAGGSPPAPGPRGKACDPSPGGTLGQGDPEPRVPPPWRTTPARRCRSCASGG